MSLTNSLTFSKSVTMRVLALSAFGKCETLDTFTLSTLSKHEDESKLKIHLIWISTSWRFLWDLGSPRSCLYMFRRPIKIHLFLLVCWLEGPINSGLLSWFRGEEFAQATAKLSSLDIREKRWKGACKRAIRYIFFCIPLILL